MAKTPKLVMVLQSFPMISETFIAWKFIGLLKRDWNVHLVIQKKGQMDLFPELFGLTDLPKRVHKSWLHRPKWLVVFLIPVMVARCFFKNTTGSIRYLKWGWKQWGLKVLRYMYLDAEIICLKPDIIHFEFGTLAQSRMYLKEILGSAIIVSFRGYDLSYVGLDHPDFYKEVWEKSDFIHLLGNDLWARAQERGCPSSKLHKLIPPAMEMDKYLPEIKDYLITGSTQRPLRILSVGRLHWKKGYVYGLQAIQLAISSGVNCEYRIIGDGGSKQEIIFTIHQLGLDKHVKLIGTTSHEKVIESLQWADVFLHSAVSEGFCNAVLEAQAMRVPVICTDAEGLSENVKNNVSGIVVPVRNPFVMAEKIEFMAQNPQIRESMGTEGRGRVLRLFNLEDQINAFDNLYNQVLANHRDVTN